MRTIGRPQALAESSTYTGGTSSTDTDEYATFAA